MHNQSLGSQNASATSGGYASLILSGSPKEEPPYVVVHLPAYILGTLWGAFYTITQVQDMQNVLSIALSLFGAAKALDIHLWSWVGREVTVSSFVALALLWPSTNNVNTKWNRLGFQVFFNFFRSFSRGCCQGNNMSRTQSIEAIRSTVLAGNGDDDRLHGNYWYKTNRVVITLAAIFSIGSAVALGLRPGHISGVLNYVFAGEDSGSGFFMNLASVFINYLQWIRARKPAEKLSGGLIDALKASFSESEATVASLCDEVNMPVPSVLMGMKDALVRDVLASTLTPEKSQALGSVFLMRNDFNDDLRRDLKAEVKLSLYQELRQKGKSPARYLASAVTGLSFAGYGYALINLQMVSQLWLAGFSVLFGVFGTLVNMGLFYLSAGKAYRKGLLAEGAHCSSLIWKGAFAFIGSIALFNTTVTYGMNFLTGSKDMSQCLSSAGGIAALVGGVLLCCMRMLLVLDAFKPEARNLGVHSERGRRMVNLFGAVVGSALPVDDYNKQPISSPSASPSQSAIV